MARVGLHVSRSAPIALRLLERWNRRTAKIEPSNLSDSLRLGFAVCLSSWLQAAKCIDRPQSAQWAVGRGMFCRQVSKLRKHSDGIVCRFFHVFSSDLCMAHATKFLNLAAQCASAGSYSLSYNPSVNRAARATKIVALGWARSMH